MQLANSNAVHCYAAFLTLNLDEGVMVVLLKHPTMMGRKGEKDTGNDPWQISAPKWDNAWTIDGCPVQLVGEQQKRVRSFTPSMADALLSRNEKIKKAVEAKEKPPMPLSCIDNPEYGDAKESEIEKDLSVGLLKLKLQGERLQQAYSQVTVT